LNRVTKAGIIGLGITILITLLLFLIANVSAIALAPFYMPWTVLILIGITGKNKKEH
jgi:hypothetical protein